MQENTIFNFQNGAVNVLYREIRNVFNKKLQTNCELARYPGYYDVRHAGATSKKEGKAGPS